MFHFHILVHLLGEATDLPLYLIPVENADLGVSGPDFRMLEMTSHFLGLWFPSSPPFITAFLQNISVTWTEKWSHQFYSLSSAT